MANESSNDENKTTEDNKDSVQTHAFNTTGDRLGDSMEETRRVDRLAKGQATGSEDDDGPQEVVEVLLSEDTSSEEQHKRDDGHDTHVAKDVLELVADTPQHDSDDSDSADEPLDTSELVLHGADRHNSRALAWLEGEDQQTPDQQDRDDAHRQSDEEPDTPRRLRVHVLKSNEVLRRSNGRRSASDIGGQGDTEEQGLGHVRIGGQVTEDGLIC